MRVRTAAPGPAHHGVVQHARTVSRLLAECGAEVVPDGPADATLAFFTAAMWGGQETFLQAVGELPRPVVGSLHDVAADYAPVAAACDQVVVGTAHEAQLLPGAHVVPLPLEPLVEPGPPPAWADVPTVGVLGFVYPGKGHLEVVDAVPTGTRVVVLGAVSPGHDDLLHALRARRDDVDVVVTGPLPESDLHAGLRAVTVPAAAYRTRGASASLSTWVAAGRVPLALPCPGALEIEQRWPGSLLLQDDAGLPAALAGALVDPVPTWRTNPPPRPDIGGLHLALLQQAAR